MSKPTLILIAILLVAVPAWTQSMGACSSQTISGTYAILCAGFASPAPNASQVPISIIGTAVTDWKGTIAATTKVSLGGAILDQTATGTPLVNSDCTGTVTYDTKTNGQPTPKLNIVYHILDGGKEMRGMSVDAGSNLTCSLRLMSR